MSPPKSEVQNPAVQTQNVPGKIRRKDRVFTLEEVEAHNTKEDCWIIIDNNIYDVNLFFKTERHPGGDVIFTHAGKDATDVFYAYHQDYVFKKKLPKYIVGKLDKPIEVTEMQKEYREMHEKIKEAGLYDTRVPYWVFKVTYPLLMIAAGIYILATSTSTNVMTYIFGGLLIGLGQHQCAFIGHDTCHVSVVGEYNSDFVLSLLLGTLPFGVSAIWWKYTHNQHHVVTNEYDIDPDITHLPFYAVNKFMFLSKKKSKDMSTFELGLARVIVGLQWLTFFPIMFFVARISMFVNNWLMLFVVKKVPTMPWQDLHYAPGWVWAERIFILLHIACYYYVFVELTPEGYRIPAFLAQHMMVGMLHVQLTLSHWDRPTKHSTEETDNWFVKQVLTGRNIEGDITNEWFLGGLHFQIEHHLYPRMPRHNLRRARDEFVRPFCEKWNIDYCSTSFFSALVDVWGTLSEVSTHAYDKRVE